MNLPEHLPTSGIIPWIFVIILLLATMRLTRLFTTDWLGEWVIVRPIKNWAMRHETAAIVRETEKISQLDSADHTHIVPSYDANDPFTWQAKLAKGFDCPFCVGYWIGLFLIVATTLLWLAPAPLTVSWGIFLGSFALSYIVGHVSKRLD